MHRSHFGQRSAASFRQNSVHEASRRKGGCSDRGWRRRRRNLSSYGRESGRQGDSKSRERSPYGHKDLQKDMEVRKEDVSGGLQKMSERSGGGGRIEQKL